MSDNDAALSDTAIRDVLCQSLRIHLEVPERTHLDPDTPFTDLGLDSTGVHALVGDLEQLLGLSVAPETLFDYPTVRLLSEHLASLRTVAGPATS